MTDEFDRIRSPEELKVLGPLLDPNWEELPTDVKHIYIFAHNNYLRLADLINKAVILLQEMESRDSIRTIDRHITATIRADIIRAEEIEGRVRAAMQAKFGAPAPGWQSLLKNPPKGPPEQGRS